MKNWKIRLQAPSPQKNKKVGGVGEKRQLKKKRRMFTEN